MNKAQRLKYESLYQQHINALRRQGKAATTIDVYAHALRRITAFYDLCPDRLSQEHLKEYFSALVQSHSWSTVKVDRNGLQFFYKHILNKTWAWVDIVKPPQTKILPDILTRSEIERFINGARELRYQTFILTAYSMGLRLGEVLSLQPGDIDSARMKVQWAKVKANLPKGPRRARDYGFLHGNAKRLLQRVQWALRVIIPDFTPRPRPQFTCARCQCGMSIVGFIRPRPAPQ